MSLSHALQDQQVNAGNANTQGDGEQVDVSEGFKDEPPDASLFDLDAFATSSLQAAASAILAVQQQQVPSDLNTSYPYEGLGTQPGRNSSPSNNAKVGSSNASLSRSSSTGRPPQSGTGEKGAVHPERHMWTPQETKALVDGCNKHGIGNWKAILNDEAFAGFFNGRTPGDLKDRFRTYFPDAYHELYPNAKTHTSRAVRSKAPDGKSIFEKGKTKERRPFTAAEDEVLKKGYEQFGSHWAIIAKDAVFEGRRKSTDLRDRFRNAFPSLYEQAGYKPRAKAPKKERRQSSSGSFSQSISPTTDTDSLQRPDLQARSETSTSVHSQAVSEHSEHSDEDESSDAVVEKGHNKDRSDSSYISLSQPGQALQTRPATWSSMDRSASHSSSTSEHPVQQGEGVKNGAIQTGTATHTSQKPNQSLRRSHSTTKRPNCKVGSLDHIVKTAFSKSNKEAMIASHQQAHLQQMLQQQNQQQQTTTMPDLPSTNGVQLRPHFNQSVSTGWVPRFQWLSGNAATNANLANMDLDQMDEIMNSHSASELLSAGGGGDDAAAISNQEAQQDTRGEEAMNIDEESLVGTNQADFASIYQQLAMATNSSPVNRALSIESFQDLLDPLSNSAVNGWDQTSGALPWTPVSSATASMNASIPAHASTSATRREHEHNQWAGDLLHRGSFSTNEQQSPQGFVSLASMHLVHNVQGLPPSRSADDNLGPQRNGNDFSFVRAPPTSGEQSQSTLERPLQRSNEQLYSTPSVHELISRSTRRQSYPPRPFGLGEDGSGEEMMQAAYGNPYPYPADDISLLNSSTGGSMTLFPSLVNNQSNDYGHNGMMRRRRSTDTLREGAFSFPQPWKGGLMDANRQVEEEGEEHQLAKDGHREIAPSVSSRHGTSDHSRSVSDAHTNNDDEDAPSRAASVGNMDLVGARDNVLYAESLPDLSSGIGGHASSTASESAFSHHHNLQISYDDMDLPSFLNRSPSFLHSNTAATTSFSNRGLNEVVRNNAKAWSASGISEAGREEDMVTHHLDQGQATQEVTKGTSKSVDLTNYNATTGGGLFSFASNPMNDAGALDRLEHLYLEGLHTNNSPLHMGQGIHGVGGGGTGSGSFGQQGMNNGAGTNNSTLNVAAQRLPANNAWWSNNERGSGGGDASGYESV